MKVVSTKRGKKNEAKICQDIESEFFWGTSVSLEDEMLDRLNLNLSDLSVGDEVDIAGKGKITSISHSAGPGSSRRSVGIQMIAVGVKPKDKPRAEFDSAYDED